ncbi:MAG: hypothetical protein IJB43_07050 [Clostridia bacterium]|nr:hypothetical protein [Clostridia bacterium]
MKNKVLNRYYLCSLAGVLIASFYPIWMGVKVVSDMIRHGTVYAEDYPKYIIPYTPIALAVIVGVALMPILIKKLEKLALAAGTGVSLIVFFASELMLESMVTVTRTFTGIFSTLEGWQMYMCYIPPEGFEERTWTEVDVLMGEYSPAFKLHFYVISVVLIISILNCFYGFAKMIVTGDSSRKKTLILQSVVSAAFLGMCIWACFTAFYRNGDITVSPLSAVLMCAFFLLFGVTVGIYIVSFTIGKKKLFSVWLPSLSAVLVTLVMYIGEIVLLSGNLYRFGEGFFFDGIKGIVLAPVDIAVVLLSGVITSMIALSIDSKEK